MYNALVLIDYTQESERRFQRFLAGRLTDVAIFQHVEGGDPEEFASLLEIFRVNGLSTQQIKRHI